MSRNTVRKYVRGEAALPGYGPRDPRPTKLDPFKAYCKSVSRRRTPDGSRPPYFCGEIGERGYSGGISQLKAYLAPLKQREAEPVVRFDRLLHHAHIVQINGESYRLKDKRKAGTALGAKAKATA